MGHFSKFKFLYFNFISNKWVINNQIYYCLATFNLKKIQWVSYNCKTRTIWCVYINQPTKISIMYNLRKIKSRDASMRSRSNSLMNVDGPKSKIMPKLEWGDLTSENESESGNYSQSDIQKSFIIEEQNKL